MAPAHIISRYFPLTAIQKYIFMYGQILIIKESAWFINKYKTPPKWKIEPISHGHV